MPVQRALAVLRRCQRGRFGLMGPAAAVWFGKPLLCCCCRRRPMLALRRRVAAGKLSQTAPALQGLQQCLPGSQHAVPASWLSRRRGAASRPALPKGPPGGAAAAAAAAVGACSGTRAPPAIVCNRSARREGGCCGMWLLLKSPALHVCTDLQSCTALMQHRACYTAHAGMLAHPSIGCYHHREARQKQEHVQ